MGIRYTLSRSLRVGSADSEAYSWILILFPIIAIAIPPVATPNPSASHSIAAAWRGTSNPIPSLRGLNPKLPPRAAMAMCASAASAVGGVPAFQPAIASSSSSSSLSKPLHAPTSVCPFGFPRLKLHCSELQIASVGAEFVCYRGFWLSGAEIWCTCWGNRWICSTFFSFWMRFHWCYLSSIEPSDAHRLADSLFGCRWLRLLVSPASNLGLQSRRELVFLCLLLLQ